MRVAFVGLGKLGWPVAAAIATRHQVVGYDIGPVRAEAFQHEAGPAGSGAMVVPRTLTVARSLREALDGAEIVFVAVQTPHQPEFEGVTPLTVERANFDTTYLKIALADVARLADRSAVVAVVSTVLPGTLRSILPGRPLRVVYNPSFIAMGMVQRDFLDPEFVLLGGDDPADLERMASFYGTITDAPVMQMSVESAELTKVAYNTVISTKVALANVLGQICHALPRADVDDVTTTLALANRRIVSPAYTRAGMGDGGGCHPRDNIAMSWLARRLSLHHDPFEQAMLARERHARWLAGRLLTSGPRPFAIAGTAYKPETAIETGSHALLVSYILQHEWFEKVLLFDPVVEGREWPIELPRATYLIGCAHAKVVDAEFPAGSVVVDPHRLVADRPGVKVVRIGEGNSGEEARLSRAS